MTEILELNKNNVERFLFLKRKIKREGKQIYIN